MGRLQGLPHCGLDWSAAAALKPELEVSPCFPICSGELPILRVQFVLNTITSSRVVLVPSFGQCTFSRIRGRCQHDDCTLATEGEYGDSPEETSAVNKSALPDRMAAGVPSAASRPAASCQLDGPEALALGGAAKPCTAMYNHTNRNTCGTHILQH